MTDTEFLEIQEQLKNCEKEIIEIDRQRAEWEKNMALFAPQNKRLDRGRSVLELGDDFAALKNLRQKREQHRLDQINLRDSIASARAEVQSSDEAFSIAETGFRDKLTEQTKLLDVVKNVQDLDKQLLDRQETAEKIRAELADIDLKLRNRSGLIGGETRNVERLTLALREARKYLQAHYIDEKLASGLPGIQKFFELFTAAREKLSSLNNAYERAIQRKQQAQTNLNDRQVMFSDVEHKFAVVEKNYEQARTLLDAALKGRSLGEWRAECERYSEKLEELNALSKSFLDERELQDKLRGIQEKRLKMQQESRSLNIREIEQAGKINELENEVQKLEKRVALLNRIEDLDLIRELLQDGTPCPLCGAMTHPYVSGTLIPDSDETRRQLAEAQKNLGELQDALSSRKNRLTQLNTDINSNSESEKEIRQNLSILSETISSKAAALGLKFGAGVPPLEELDRVRQRTRDSLQMAKNILDNAELAEKNLKNASYELEKTRENRGELTRYHQEALFNLQGEKTEERRLEEEAKSQEEAFNSIKRELVSQLSLYGYKNLPDENPVKIIDALISRSEIWQNESRRKDALERELVVAQNSLNNLKKEIEAVKLNKNETADRLKAVEAEKNSIQQQRLVLFESKNPNTEKERMERDVNEFKQLLETRRKIKNDSAARLNNAMQAMHALETEMANEREQIQKSEIAFGKKLLAAGFKNEDDFLSSALSDEERRELQARLKGLTQKDLDLTAARENVMARQMELQAKLS